MRVAVLVEGWPGESGPLTAETAARTVRAAWLSARPGSEVTTIQVGDGGPRSADAIAGSRRSVGGADMVALGDGVVLAPAGRALRWSPPDLAAALFGLAAEAAEAPRAESRSSRRVVVPLGDIPPAGDAADLWGGDLGTARAALAGLDLVALVSSDRPLLGFHGMSAAVREGREADAALATAAQEQETRWRERAAAADRVASQSDLLAGPRRLSDQPRTGAAGGLAYALAALGARLAPAALTLAEVAGADRAVQDADLVVVVVPTLSHAAADHGTAAPAAQLAAARGVPAVVIAADIHVGKRDLMAAGVHGAHAGDAGEQALAEVVTRVAHTWDA